MATLAQRAAMRKIKKFVRGRRLRAKKGLAIRRTINYNPMPTFTETYLKASDNLTVFPGSGIGKVFKVAISDIPQVAQYMNLYTQYRINWVKVMLLPTYDTTSSDFNATAYNQSIPVSSAGMARIVYSIQNSPGETDPATENDVLTDNGCKIKAFKTKWSCSFNPVPDIKQTTDVNSTIYTRQKTRQWFNYDSALSGNNPKHGAVTAFITLPGTSVGDNRPAVTYNCYYKVNFSLRDPK